YRALRLEALKDSPLAFVEQYDEAVAKPDGFWRERVGNASAGTASCTYVAVAGDRLVGKASCFLEPERTAHVVGVYVTPRRRASEKPGSVHQVRSWLCRSVGSRIVTSWLSSPVVSWLASRACPISGPGRNERGQPVRPCPSSHAVIFCRSAGGSVSNNSASRSAGRDSGVDMTRR